MSYGLTVLAIEPTATPAEIRQMYRECGRLDHVEGDLDPRIVAFYEDLRLRFPDSGILGNDTPWADEPYPGIDHVHMHLRYGSVSDNAAEVITELADRHGLVLYEPHGDDIHLPVR